MLFQAGPKLVNTIAIFVKPGKACWLDPPPQDRRKQRGTVGQAVEKEVIKRLLRISLPQLFPGRPF
jgi:hypothetical protein